DDVRDPLALRDQLALPMADLVHDLAGGEIADEAHLAGRAERAGHWAARLCREAHRVPRSVMRHEHGLDVVPIVETKEHLSRLAVGALDLAHRLDRAPTETLRERRA